MLKSFNNKCCGLRYCYLNLTLFKPLLLKEEDYMDGSMEVLDIRKWDSWSLFPGVMPSDLHVINTCTYFNTGLIIHNQTPISFVTHNIRRWGWTLGTILLKSSSSRKPETRTCKHKLTNVNPKYGFKRLVKYAK